jgi:hypothetical protein
MASDRMPIPKTAAASVFHFNWTPEPLADDIIYDPWFLSWPTWLVPPSEQFPAFVPRLTSWFALFLPVARDKPRVDLYLSF